MNELEEKIKGFKQVSIMLVLIVIVLVAMLGYNYVEVRKFKEISDGTYVTVDNCQAMCDARYGQDNMQIVINFTGEDIVS